MRKRRISDDLHFAIKILSPETKWKDQRSDSVRDGICRKLPQWCLSKDSLQNS